METNTTDIVLLAEYCLEAAKAMKAFLATNGDDKELGFDADALPRFPECDEATENLRSNLRCASKRMYDLITGPDQCLMESSLLSLQWIGSMRYICRYGVADGVPDNGVIAYEDLAKACGIDSTQLKLNLRFAMTNRVFCEPRPGFVAHTIASLELKKDNPMLCFVQWLTGDCAPIVTHQIDAYEKWGHGSQEPNETAVNFAYNRDGGFFDFIQSDPVRETRFGTTIRQVSKQPAASPKHIANGFNWELLGNGTVVDVGGHIGYCAVTIAEAAPKLKVIVQDRPQVVAMATDPKTSAVPKELQDRISFEVHDYYQPQKTHADAYFYRKCLLNLSDKYAVRLIEALSPALRKGNRLLIMDFIQTDGPIADSTFERYYRAVDLQMMSYYNCRYRTLDEWNALVSAGDSRLVFESMCTSPGSAMPILSFIVQ